MGVAMPGVSGRETTREIKRHWPHIQVLALTVHRSSDYFFRMLEAGASGYVLKGADPGDLITAIHTVYQGEVFLYPSMSTKLVAQYLQWVRSGGASPAYADLTAREVEVLRLIAEGHTNAEIGDMIKLSHHTVQTHSRTLWKNSSCTSG